MIEDSRLSKPAYISDVNVDMIFSNERGIINGIILDIKDDVEKMKAFLQSIRFTEGELDWVDDLLSIKWLIEPSLSDFGAPDLVFIAKTKNKKYVFFVEAKLLSYNKSAARIDEKLLIPKNYRDISSRVNIQLALKYRFYLVFKQKISKNPNLEDINETNDTQKKYNDKRRSIDNKVVVDICKEILIDSEKAYFVALTNDNKETNPFTDNCYLPAIGKDNWDNDKSLFGLVSFHSLETVLWENTNGEKVEGIINKEHGHYGPAARILNISPPQPDNGERDNYELLPVAKNIKKWSAEQKMLADYALKKYEHAYRILSSCYTVNIGSNTTILRIQADPEDKKRILLCFGDEGKPDEVLGIQLGKTYMIRSGINKTAFYCVPVSIKKEIKKLRPKVLDYISSFELKLGID